MSDYIKACRVLHSPIRWPVQVETFYGDYVLQQIVYLIPRTKKRSDYIVIKIDFAWVALVLLLFFFHLHKYVYIWYCLKSWVWKHEYLKKNTSTCNNSEANSNNIRRDRLDVDYHKTLQKLNVFTRSLSLKWLSWRKLSLRAELILCNYFWRGDKWETH